MELLYIIIAVLFAYSVYMTFFSLDYHRQEEKKILGTLLIAKKSETEKNPEGIFLEINVSPEELKDGENALFKIKYVIPRK